MREGGVADVVIGDIEIANTLGLDKSTLMSIIDRLEDEGLIVREADPSNRRVRIPRTTERGQQVLTQTLVDRDRAVEQTLASYKSGELETLRTLLWQIATAE